MFKGDVMAIVRQHDKRSGITYAYESISHWDKQKQQSRAKRTLIGRVDDKTGEIVPTKATNKPQKGTASPMAAKRGPVPGTETSRKFYGATYLLDALGNRLGLSSDLKQCFPHSYKQIMSIAYYLILEADSPLSRFSKWSSLHRHPYMQDIPSQRSSELFASITEEDRYRFFQLQAARRCEKEYWAYDITSVSSYSECLKQVRYGMNKEHDHLAQLNLALVFGQESSLPFYYRKLPGNVTDVKTVRTMLADLDFLNLQKVHLVMDRGFYSAENINELYKEHHKFLIGAKLSLKFVKEQLDSVRHSLREWTNYCDNHEVFATCVPIKWDYLQERPNKGDTIRGERRMYLHLYFNSERAAEDEQRQTRRLLALQKELQSGKRKPENSKLYDKYFETHETPARGVTVIARQEAIDEARRNYGYFALVSNEIKDPIKALDVYRNKDLVEKAFGNLKERLSMRRLLVSSEQSLDGKLFVQFVALIYLSCIKKAMQNNNLFGKHTIQSLMDQFDVIECFGRPGKDLRVGEITKKQQELYNTIGVVPPSSL
ncbi:MAG TPA: IS1634 family transposase [Caldisericia bacterium]|nr:IS1634 family transposase [Caldisericia bacterium]